MTANQFDMPSILNLLSAIAALSAVVIAVLSEMRAQKRFKQGNEIQERIAAASQKPLLAINDHTVAGNRRITLENNGTGTAVITKIRFTKDTRSGDSIPSILDIGGPDFEWDAAQRFSDQSAFLRAGGRYVLLELSADRLRGQGFDNAKIQSIFESLTSEIKGIKVSFEVEDALGNKQPSFTITIPSHT
jgi:hypothetical protein